jgi:hypothetical protein
MTEKQKNFPSSKGFLKITEEKPAEITRENRVALVRKGNELFNNGRIETARRIFLTVGYSDGLIRVGDYYYANNRPLDTLRMYWQAPDRHKVEQIAEKMASVIKYWLQEDKGNSHNE